MSSAKKHFSSPNKARFPNRALCFLRPWPRSRWESSVRHGRPSGQRNSRGWGSGSPSGACFPETESFAAE